MLIQATKYTPSTGTTAYSSANSSSRPNLHELIHAQNRRRTSQTLTYHEDIDGYDLGYTDEYKLLPCIWVDGNPECYCRRLLQMKHLGLTFWRR